MKNVFKSRWFKFVLRTLLDWTLFVVIVIVVGYTINSATPKDLNYNPPEDNEFQSIEELEDSIRRMQHKIDLYEKAVNWIRNADDDELQRGIEQIRSVPKDVPLP